MYHCLSRGGEHASFNGDFVNRGADLCKMCVCFEVVFFVLEEIINRLLFDVSREIHEE